MSWKNDWKRRQFLQALGVGGALPFLESIGARPVRANTNTLKRLVIVSQPHMSLGYHRIPDLANGAYGNGNPSRLSIDTDLGFRVGTFGSDPGGLGGFYRQGKLKDSSRLQSEMMVVNGLPCTYREAQGHQSDGNGTWRGGGQNGGLNTGARYPLSGSLHKPMVTIDHIVAAKIHQPGQRMLFMGSGRWGGGGASTNESVTPEGDVVRIKEKPLDVFNGNVFEGGRRIDDLLAGGNAPAPTGDPRKTMAADDFAILEALSYTKQDRQRLMSQGVLSQDDKTSLEQYFDFMSDSLKDVEARLERQAEGPSIAAGCANPELGTPNKLPSYLQMMGAAFLCDISRVAFISTGDYTSHGNWHDGADGDTNELAKFNKSAEQTADVADFLAGMTDPETGEDMLKSTLVLQITNCSMAVKGQGRDTKHSYGDYSYFSIGGSSVFNTGKMYDALDYKDGDRQEVSGPVPTVNQYLQTVAAAFGATSDDWGNDGFGPWLSNNWRGIDLRADNNAKRNPIPGLLKS